MGGQISEIQFVSIDDFAKYRDITPNIDDIKRLNPYCMEAQRYDFKPFIGDEMYFQMCQAMSVGDTDPNYTIYNDLLNGKQYNNLVNNLIIYGGAKCALVYYAYARFIGANNATVTAYGIVQKKNEESQAISNLYLQQLVGNAQAAALAEMRMMERFIRDNINDYPLFMYFRTRNKRGGINIRPVGGNPNPNTLRNLNYPFRDHNDRYY